MHFYTVIYIYYATPRYSVVDTHAVTGAKHWKLSTEMILLYEYIVRATLNHALHHKETRCLVLLFLCNFFFIDLKKYLIE